MKPGRRRAAPFTILDAAMRGASTRARTVARAAASSAALGVALLAAGCATVQVQTVASALPGRSVYAMAGGSPDDLVREAQRLCGTRPVTWLRQSHDTRGAVPPADPESLFDRARAWLQPLASMPRTQSQAVVACEPAAASAVAEAPTAPADAATPPAPRLLMARAADGSPVAASAAPRSTSSVAATARSASALDRTPPARTTPQTSTPMPRASRSARGAVPPVRDESPPVATPVPAPPDVVVTSARATPPGAAPTPVAAAAEGPAAWVAVADATPARPAPRCRVVVRGHSRATVCDRPDRVASGAGDTAARKPPPRRVDPRDAALPSASPREGMVWVPTSGDGRVSTARR